MDVVKLLTIIGGFVAGQLNGEIVNLFSMCGREMDGEAKLVSGTEIVTVEIYGKDWPTGMNSCEVLFRSKNGRDALYYTFKRFQVDDFRTDLKVHAKSSLVFFDYTFNKFVPPSIGERGPGIAVSSIALTVTRSNTAAATLNATVELTSKQPKESNGLTKVNSPRALIVAGIVLTWCSWSLCDSAGT